MKRPALALFCALVVATAVPASGGATEQRQLGLVPVASGFSRPDFVTAPASEPGRLYVVEQPGVIRVVENGQTRAEPFLDIRSRVGSQGNEQGLLGLAFDPAYAANHRFYVDYTDTNGNTRVVRFRSDGKRAILSSARQLLYVGQPYANHNGGMLAFAPSGDLWVGMGDGGAGGDPGNRAQNPSSLLGKLVVLDPTGRRKPRIAALGLRNPWRFSFDRKTDDLYIGDVGQNSVEEVDFVRAGTKGLLNFGWHVWEGRSHYTDGALGPGRLTWPIATYTHNFGCSVTGGYVYRGTAVPAATGRYFYGDFCSGTVWSLTARAGHVSAPRTEPFKVPNLSSFGEDVAGELYLVSLAGTVYRLAS
jgi:glucose/arabinose dehydrogenase